MTSLIWLAAMSFLLQGRCSPSTLLLPAQGRLMHSFHTVFPQRLRWRQSALLTARTGGITSCTVMPAHCVGRQTIILMGGNRQGRAAGGVARRFSATPAACDRSASG